MFSIDRSEGRYNGWYYSTLTKRSVERLQSTVTQGTYSVREYKHCIDDGSNPETALYCLPGLFTCVPLPMRGIFQSRCCHKDEIIPVARRDAFIVVFP
jgi:hypothetical protein